MGKSKNQVSTIVFDIGGVLLDWDPRYLYRKIFTQDKGDLERFLDEVQFFNWNLQQDAGRPFGEAVDELCAQFPQYCDLIRVYHTRWEESISGPIQPTVEILQSLKRTQYPLYGLSNWSTEKFRIVRHKYEFLDWFEDIIISGDVKIVKPDPRIFSLLLERIQRQAAECLLIDDSAANIEAANKLGFCTIHFQSPDQLESELIRMGIL